MLRVGMRHGKAVLLSVDAAGMYRDGHQFFVTATTSG
jgi:RNA:NAD 2'-phosphotransferase (TPT1/KptA family)